MSKKEVSPGMTYYHACPPPTKLGASMSNEELAAAIATTILETRKNTRQTYAVLIQHLKELLSIQAARAAGSSCDPAANAFVAAAEDSLRDVSYKVREEANKKAFEVAQDFLRSNAS